MLLIGLIPCTDFGHKLANVARYEFFSAILWAQKLRSRNFVWQIPCRSSSSSSFEVDIFLARLSPSCSLENLTTSEAEAVIIEIKSAIAFNWWSCQVFNSGHHLSPLMATRLAFAWYCDSYENIGIICREKAFAGYHDTLTFMKILTSSAERKKNWVIIATLIWQRFRILELRHKANVLGRIWNGPKFQIAENEENPN